MCAVPLNTEIDLKTPLRNILYLPSYPPFKAISPPRERRRRNSLRTRNVIEKILFISFSTLSPLKYAPPSQYILLLRNYSSPAILRMPSSLSFYPDLTRPPFLLESTTSVTPQSTGPLQLCLLPVPREGSKS